MCLPQHLFFWDSPTKRHTAIHSLSPLRLPLLLVIFSKTVTYTYTVYVY